jgi:hypothetical protein
LTDEEKEPNLPVEDSTICSADQSGHLGDRQAISSRELEAGDVMKKLNALDPDELTSDASNVIDSGDGAEKLQRKESVVDQTKSVKSSKVAAGLEGDEDKSKHLHLVGMDEPGVEFTQEEINMDVKTGVSLCKNGANSKESELHVTSGNETAAQGPEFGVRIHESDLQFAYSVWSDHQTERFCRLLLGTAQKLLPVSPATQWENYDDAFSLYQEWKGLANPLVIEAFHSAVQDALKFSLSKFFVSLCQHVSRYCKDSFRNQKKRLQAEAKSKSGSEAASEEEKKKLQRAVKSLKREMVAQEAVVETAFEVAISAGKLVCVCV